MLFRGATHPVVKRGLLTRLGVMALLGLMVVLTACGGSTPASSTPTGGGTPAASCPNTKTLNGAGATFPAPLFSKMFSVYPSAKCGANVNYQPVGSGAGITALLNKTVDFGASDAPMTDAQLTSSTAGPVLHIPDTLGAVSMSYNLSGIPATTHLKFTGPVIADIFLGKVKTWDDPAIKSLNPGVTLPSAPITVVHRSDGSGTTGIFTHYLSAVSPEWQSKVGASTTVNWPVGVGGKGNTGVAAAIKSTANSFGYVELAYVIANNFAYGLVQNAAGNYIAPSLDGAKEDAANFTNIPDDLRFYIVNAPGANSYPISGFSWLLVYQNQTNADKGQAIANLLWWVIHDGQSYSTALTYVPLPASIVTKEEAKIKTMTCGGSPCYKG